jgi:hypothetical protein
MIGTTLMQIQSGRAVPLNELQFDFQGYQTRNWAAKFAENFAISGRSSCHIFSMTIFTKVAGNICTCLLCCLANNLLHNIQITKHKIFFQP